MFTGIIDHKAKLIEIHPLGAEGSRFVFETHFSALTVGESIAVDGVCLTVTEEKGGTFSADLSPETLRLTTLAKKSVGQAINIERALKMGDAMGGHWVTGHVDGIGTLEKLQGEGDFWKMIFSYPEEFRALVTPKGSITVNGVSLTINETTKLTFSVMVIPHTSQVTNLGTLRENDLVNLEFDWMSKIIVRQLNERLERQAT